MRAWYSCADLSASPTALKMALFDPRVLQDRVLARLRIVHRDSYYGLLIALKHGTPHGFQSPAMDGSLL